MIMRNSQSIFPMGSRQSIAINYSLVGCHQFVTLYSQSCEGLTPNKIERNERP